MKLVHGEGAPDTGACWMSAINWYSGSSDWTDQPECVDPIIKPLCILINDSIPESKLEDFIGPYLFMPLGTNKGEELSQKRAFRCIDWLCREFLPYVDKALNPYRTSGAHIFTSSLDPIVCEDSAYKAEVLWQNSSNEKSYTGVSSIRARNIRVRLKEAIESVRQYPNITGRCTAVAVNSIFHYVPDLLIDTVINTLLDLVLELCEMGREEPKRERMQETLECLTVGSFPDNCVL